MNLTQQDEEDIKTICNPYETEHKNVAQFVYNDEFNRIRRAAESERDMSIYSNFKKTKYRAVCLMMETMLTYIKKYKNYFGKEYENRREAFSDYMRHENIGDIVSGRDISHYRQIFDKVCEDFYRNKPERYGGPMYPFEYDNVMPPYKPANSNWDSDSDSESEF
jgi:hypothetical protein